MENPENNGKNMDVVRDEMGRVVSGTLNPKGKPKGIKHFTTLVKEALQKKGIDKKTGKEFVYENALIEKIMHKAIADGDNKMIELIWNYYDGKPTQPIDLGNDDVWDKLAELEKMVKPDDKE